MHKKFFFLSVFSLFFVVTGCQDVLECIINRKPVLSDTPIDRARQNEYFFAKITAEIKNEPRDNDYFYDYSIFGDLPEGLDVIFDYRDVIIEGRPRVKGRYRFTIDLYVEQFDNYCENQLNDCDGLCEERTSRTYVLTVN